MMAAAVRTNDSSKGSETLYMAFELGERQWKLGFTIGAGQKPWRRTITARDVGAVLHEIARAEQRFGLAPEAAVRSCYEAGRDGFWLHRALHAQGIVNVVVDSASIEVNRRQRRAKSDGLDVEGLLRGAVDRTRSSAMPMTAARTAAERLRRRTLLP